MVWQSRWVKAANGQVGFCVDMLGSRGGDGRGKLWSVVLRCADAGFGSHGGDGRGKLWSVVLRCADAGFGSRGGDGRGKLWFVVLRCADAGLGSHGRFWSVLLRMGKFRQSRRVMVRQALDWRGKSR